MKTKGSKKQKAQKKPAKAKKAVSKKKPVKAKKAAAKKSPAKKAVAKKSPAKKAAAKKKPSVKLSAPKVAAAKKSPVKKAVPAKASPSKKAAAPKPAAVAKTPVATKPIAPKPAPEKMLAAVAPVVAAPVDSPPSAASASAAAKPRAVLRIAGGRARGPQGAATNGSAHGGGAFSGGGVGPRAVHASEDARAAGARFEVNPKLESTRGKLKTPPPAAMAAQGVKGMSVAEKRRAEAEAMFQQYAKPGAVLPAPDPLPAAGPNGNHAAAAGLDEYGRFSPRDSLMTMLRMAEHRAQALEAATELADRHRLPADQGLLLKVIDLGEARLTKLALEELLELDDRGRVRPNDQLRGSLARIETRDPETRELKDLLLAKVGVRV